MRVRAAVKVSKRGTVKVSERQAQLLSIGHALRDPGHYKMQREEGRSQVEECEGEKMKIYAYMVWAVCEVARRAPE